MEIKKENQKKVNNFLNDLKSNDTILKVAKHFNKNIDEVCKVVEKFIVILYYRNGEIKQIKLDFLETQTYIKIYQLNNFKKQLLPLSV